MKWVRALAALCLGLAVAMPCAAATADRATVRLLDDFSDSTPWQASASDGVQASLRTVRGAGGPALCLDFDFGAVSGYAVARRELPLDFPQNYEFTFGLRGDAPPNTLQFKLLDASGENVWWVNRPDFAFPHEWERVRFKRRHVEFAWGPTTDRELRRSATLELVVARGQGGGKGAVCFEQLVFRELPAQPSAPPTPVLRTTSSLAPHTPAYALDGSQDTAWRSDPSTGAEQTLTVDFQQPRELGGLSDPLAAEPARIALRHRLLGRRHALANAAARGKRSWRDGPALVAGIGDAISPPAALRWSRRGLWTQGDRVQGSRVRRVAQCLLHGHCQGGAARPLPARLFRRTELLDRGRHQRRHRARSAVGGRRARGRPASARGRAVPAH